MIGNPLLLGGGDYEISRSVRLRSSASAYFNRTPASAGDRQKWTWSGWVKLGSLVDETFVSLGTTLGVNLRYASGALQSNILTVGSTTSTAVYRDPSAWYHIVIAVDTTQASNNSRLRLYVNGSEVAYSANATITQNANLGANNTTLHTLGVDSRTGSVTAGTYFDGYLTEINFIDGQALTPSSFGESNATTGVWQPKKYTGTYGTNGFYLNFSDNSNNTAATIGKDYSGNGNNWTPNNISVTSGSTYDSMLDVPTQWADGGNGRGNYAVLNPLDFTTIGTISEANLRFAQSSSGSRSGRATIGVVSGKWYWEVTNLGGNNSIGIGNASMSLGGYCGQDANGWSYFIDGNKYNNNTATAYGASYTTNDVIGVALDMDAGTLTFYKNGVSQGQAFSSLSGTMFPAFSASSVSNVTFVANFGQRPFSYTPPSGFKALNTLNLPAPTILKGNQYFDVVTRNGFGSSGGSITSLNFQPDLFWEKQRNGVSNHYLVDSVRGVSKYLNSDATAVEGTLSTYVTAFNSNGYTMGSSDFATGNTMVDWLWKESATAGFDIVTYTGTGANRTVAHSLGVAPSMMIVKNRTTAIAGAWTVYHSAMPSPASSYLFLELTDARATVATPWNGTAPTSSVFSVDGSNRVNQNGNNFVAYLFSEVAGFSRFGSYTGNGSSDGPFVFTGFRPAFLMIKRTDSTGSWFMNDDARPGYNVNTFDLQANSSGAESSNSICDFTANGFKIRIDGLQVNASGGTFVFMAFAENPFKNALAR
jgi:hypothetical protein